MSPWRLGLSLRSQASQELVDKQWFDSTHLPSFEAIIAIMPSTPPVHGGNLCYNCCLIKGLQFNGSLTMVILVASCPDDSFFIMTDVNMTLLNSRGDLDKLFTKAFFVNVLQAPRWESTFEISIEDRGMTCAPIFLRAEKARGNTLQDLVELWHSQPPFRYALVSSATTVCLQVNRFPALGIRSKKPVKWNRQVIRLPCFTHTSGCTVQWKEFVAVAPVILHRGEESQCGHYQSVLRTGGRCFLTDDGRSPMAYAHNEEMDKDVYLIWMTSAAALTPMHGRTVEKQSNSFVPIVRAS